MVSLLLVTVQLVFTRLGERLTKQKKKILSFKVLLSAELKVD